MKFFAYLRPETPFFGGHRWVFWPIALLPAVALLLSRPCMKDGNWLEPMLLTFVVMACLWEAHLQTMRLGLASWGMLLWQVCKRALRTLLSVFIAGLLPLFLVGAMLPHYSCYGDRAKVSEAILQISGPRQEINERASINKTLKGAGLGLEFPKFQGSKPSKGFVLENGVIILVMEEPPATMLFTPKLVDANSGAIEWSCRGYPSKSMPMMCREPE